MGKRLSDVQLQQYAQDGYTHPIPVLSADEVSAAHADIEAFEARKINRREDIPGSVVFWNHRIKFVSTAPNGQY
ncbi:uncharacterized protein METZ01_LOCUS224308 [marine metagenome]|uniref:Phytanoyl-CoA dioxygenase n=1 Tax=marine metagenome TaxID=408172 RepID=A0A382GA22_9ZZZZ